MTVPTQPCPATKRNGEICNSTRISQSGFCFAHDPASAEWRRRGGRPKRQENPSRAQKGRIVKDARLDSMVESLRMALVELSSQPPTPTTAYAMARLADSIAQIIYRTAPDSDDEGIPVLPPDWADYPPVPYPEHTLKQVVSGENW